MSGRMLFGLLVGLSLYGGQVRVWGQDRPRASEDERYDQLLEAAATNAELGLHDAALRILEQADALKPGEVAIHWRMAESSLALGDRERGLAALAAMLERRPEAGNMAEVVDLRKRLEALPRDAPPAREDDPEPSAPVAGNRAEMPPGTEDSVDLGGGVWLVMVWIPPGEFEMGSPAGELGRDGDEQRHRVGITKGFWLGKYEVTQGQWAAVMGSNPSRFQEAGSSAPVEKVSWEDAAAFCEALNRRVGPGFRLPTEAEWEYACRAGTRTALNNGRDLTSTTGVCGNLDAVGWYGKNSGGRTRVVGGKAPNRWGLHDMHGNVWEWCADWYDEGYYTQSPVDDPVGPASGVSRVFRGGSWLNAAPGAAAPRFGAGTSRPTGTSTWASASRGPFPQRPGRAREPAERGRREPHGSAKRPESARSGTIRMMVKVRRKAPCTSG